MRRIRPAPLVNATRLLGRRVFLRVGLGPLLGWLVCLPVHAGEGSADLPNIEDAALLDLFPQYDVRLPPRLFTPELIERLRQNKATVLDMTSLHFFGDAALGKRCAEQIPETRWHELIPPYAGFTMQCDSTSFIPDRGKCPFCGKTYGGARMTLEDFFDHPFQARTVCCGATIYEHEADMPADYKARPNHVEKIPHLDGTVFEYHFYAPPGTENAGPELASDRKHWFCSASEVWAADEWAI